MSARTDFVDDFGDMMRPARDSRESWGLSGRPAWCGGSCAAAPNPSATRGGDVPARGVRPLRRLPACHIVLSELDLWVRLLDRGDFFGIPKTLAAFRIASGIHHGDDLGTLAAATAAGFQ